ncbi:MAG: hypothetical protein ACOZAM_15105 [Pseudomonadota bacterium]
MRRLPVTVTTAADGTVTAYSPRFTGKIVQIEYVKDGANGYANGVDFTLTGEATGIGLWTQSDVNASAVVAPRQPTHSQVGAALLYAAGGTAQTDKIALANDRVKIVLAQGGASKVGVFHIVIE